MQFTRVELWKWIYTDHGTSYITTWNMRFVLNNDSSFIALWIWWTACCWCISAGYCLKFFDIGSWIIPFSRPSFTETKMHWSVYLLVVFFSSLTYLQEVAYHNKYICLKRMFVCIYTKCMCYIFHFFCFNPLIVNL